MTEELARPRNLVGKFKPKFKPEDFEEIREMIKDGRTTNQIKVAIMQARDVSEPTAVRWIKLAKKGGEKRGKQLKQS